MSVENKAPTTDAPAPAAATIEQEIAGFQTEEYEGGEPVSAPAPTPKEDPKPAEPQKEAEDASKQGAEEERESAEPPAEGEEDGQPAPKKTFQERINELTRARRENERLYEQERRRREELERELETLRGGSKKQDPPKSETVAAPKKEEPPVDPDAPKPDDFEFGELDSRYLAAVVSYNTKKAYSELREQEKKENAEKAVAQAEKERYESFVKRAETGAAAKYPDYIDKVFVGAANGDYPISKELGEMVMESSVGDEIAYHLATHVDEAVRIHNLPPILQAREFGKLEMRFSVPESAATAAGAAPSTPPAKTPQAPAPVLPARGAGGKFQVGADTEDFAAFERSVNGGK